MIDAKRAVEVAKEKAAEMLSQRSSTLEEIERESYKDRDVWSITLSFPRDLDQVAPFLKLSADPLQYKRFLIDVETGELLAMKLREVASR
jgi:chorismate mutase